MRIVLLTKNYGKNVTGATLATHTFIHFWALNSKVNEIIVLAQHVFDHDEAEKIHVVHYHFQRDISSLITHYNTADTIFYSDDHYGSFLADARVTYIHTYHGNWPDARWISIEYFFKSFYFIHEYSKAIKHASVVVNVSEYMKRFTDIYNKKSVLIHNGIDESKIAHLPAKRENRKQPKCLMLGNIDARKYGLLPKLLDKIEKNCLNIHIDIYGRIVNERLARKLQSYKSVSVLGFVPFSSIDISSYSFLLSMSTKENLPISIVEILKSHLPVLAIPAGGIPEVINENCGILLDPGDMKKNLMSIRAVLNGDVNFSFNNKILDDFSWEKSSLEYMRIFESCMNKKGGLPS